MKLHLNRRDSKYIDTIKKALSIDEMIKNSIPIESKKRFKKADYDKVIRIDFLGIAASTFFDLGEMLHNHVLSNELKCLLEKAQFLNEQGIFIKMRILFEYPYSIAAYSRIQAESLTKRASINEPKYKRHLNIINNLSEKDYEKSFYLRIQESALKNIQELLDDLQLIEGWNENDNVNSITLRFTPVNVGICSLFINNKVFYDPYLNSKENRRSDRFVYYSPVVELDSQINKDKKAFLSLEDHFRYLWDMDITLDCKDATNFIESKPDSLADIRKPQEVTFNNKSDRIKLNKKNLTKKQINDFLFHCRNKIIKFSPDLTPTPAFENAFITCSWEKKKDKSSSPNHHAEFLEAFLRQDFSDNENPILNVTILNAAGNEFLARQLYKNLDNTTVGMILMTKDIESADGKFYSKPNVYHELGYLMRLLGKERIIIILEEGVQKPSNIQDIIHIQFPTERLSLSYCDILMRLADMINLDRQIHTNSLVNHLRRLSKYLEDSAISQAEFSGAKERIHQRIKLINSKNEK